MAAPLIDSIVARLTRNGFPLGMATLITPTIAITAEWVVENDQDYILQELVIGGSTHPEPFKVSVLARDPEVGFAALQLHHRVGAQVLPVLLSTAKPEINATWECLTFSPYTDEHTRPSGVIGGIETVDGRKLIRLIQRSSSELSVNASGAPVMVGDSLVGVIANGQLPGGNLYAIPISEILKSSQWRLVAAEIDASQNATPEDSAPEFNSSRFFERLSASSFDALAHANGIRIWQGQDKLHMEHLIAGLFQKVDGPTRTEFSRAGIDGARLKTVLDNVHTVLPAENAYSPQFITGELPTLSAHVQQAFVAAAAFADATEARVVRSRHLLRGALSVKDCSLIGALLQMGADPEKMLLDPPVNAVAERRPTQAGITSDDPQGEDLLEIKHEVEALCTVLASKDVTPPISLGLFGDWGSGKSFFMKKMEARFNKLQKIARNEDSAYCENIVQLWFNAWHYMDTNLWASLAKEIFDKLAQELASQEALKAGTIDPEYERAQLLSQKAKANEAVAKAEQEKRDADTKVRASEQQLTSIQSGETPVAVNPRAVLREVYRFAGQQPEVRKTVVAANNMLDKKVEEAASALNIDKDAGSVREDLLELRGIWGYARAIWLAARNTKNKWLWMLSAICLLIVVGVVLLLPLVLSQEWIQSAWLRVTGIALALLAAVSPFTPAALKALKIIHDAIKSSNESIEQARLETEKNLQLEHQKLQKDAVDAQTALETAVTTASKLTEKLEDLRADKQMSNFIRQRQQSSDYTQYLGVIAKARNDFEQLSTLLTKEQKRSEAEQAQFKDLLPRIDRIILYIDDLDRCPENKVVDVLQAVHLLLAFPLFVVVVGVDPRWLLHSLRQHSKAFQDDIEADESSEEERTHWRSTPLNYLEKIFQIPFTLNPIGKSGFGKMIETLTEPPKADQKKAEPKEGKVTEAETDKGEKNQPKPEAAPIEISAKAPGTPPVSDDQAVVSAPAVKESWTTKVLSFLRRTFGPSKTAGAAAAGADSEIQAQAGPAPDAAETTTNVTQEQPEEAAAPESSGSQKTQTSASEATDHGTEEVIEPRPDHLLINSWEQKFMKELHELIPTPRATKRFVNIYRLIRASVDLDDKLDLEDFTGNDESGKYRQALLLLAILTGYPDQATEILRELLEKQHPEPWWEFIDSFEDRAKKRVVASNGKSAVENGVKQPNDSIANEVTVESQPATASISETGSDAGKDEPVLLGENLANVLNDADAESWQQLLGKLQNIRHLFALAEPCKDFVDWAPKVARYSFQSGRVLLTRSVRSAEVENDPS